MDSQRITIVILNYNGKEDTLECLKSVKKIDYPNLDVILVDNGSTDGSQEEFITQFPDITLIQNQTNLGFAGGMNVGILKAIEEGSPYIFVLNNDTVLDTAILKDLKKACDLENQIGAAVPKIYNYYSPNILDNCGLDITFGPHICRDRGHGKRDSEEYSRQIMVDGLTGCGVLLKTSVLEDVGLFDESFFFYGEDVDLSLRLRKANYKVLFVPSAKMWHKISATAGSNPNVKKGKLIGETTIFCMKKHAGFREWIIFFSKCFIFFPWALIKQTAHGNFTAFWAKSISAIESLFHKGD